MILRRFQFAMLLGVALAATAMTARAQGEGSAKKTEKGEKIDAPVSGAADPCGPTYRTVPVTEWVPQTYTTTRTVYRTVTQKVKVKGFRYERVPVQKTRTVTYYVRKPVYKNVTRTVTERVPCWTTKTVMKPCYVTKKVTVWKTRRVDRGHWECVDVPAPFKDFCNRLGHRMSNFRLFGRNNCCDPCDPCNNNCCDPCPPRRATRKVKRWRSCYVCERYPVTCCKRVCVMKPHTCRVCTYKCVTKKVTCRVCTYECVPCTKKVTCCEYVCRKVPCTTWKCVTRCVPCKEKVTCCRMVCRTVHRRVAVCDPCCDPCADPCCNRGRGGFRLFSGLFNRRGCCDSGCH